MQFDNIVLAGSSNRSGAGVLPLGCTICSTQSLSLNTGKVISNRLLPLNSAVNDKITGSGKLTREKRQSTLNEKNKTTEPTTVMKRIIYNVRLMAII